MSKEIQEDLLNWDFVKKQIDKNTYPRINWRDLIGMSLTRACAKFKAVGLTSLQAYDILCSEHPNWSNEVKRRLKIGVAARFGEMGTSQKELNK